MKKYIFPIAACFSASLFLFSAVPAWSAPEKIKPDTSVPTKITADKVVYEADKQSVVFTGNVYVNRPDLEMWMDVLTVYFHPASKDKKASDKTPTGMGAGEVKKMIATGQQVRMKSETRTGLCKRAEYDVDMALLTMTGDPKLQDGDRTLSGETVRYFTDERRSEVVGSAKKRVEAVFGGPAPIKNPVGGR
jgi:lipopolysaccharide export system protein LptA